MFFRFINHFLLFAKESQNKKHLRLKESFLEENLNFYFV